MKELHEECGVFGVFAKENIQAAGLSYYGLYALQHRGQESCGIVVNDDGVFSVHKDLGQVGDVFSRDVLDKFPLGKISVAHVRYGTTGATDRANCQPIVVNHGKGHLALAHNGNLSNAAKLRNTLEMRGAIFHGTSDTEIIAYLITQQRLMCASIEAAVKATVPLLEGAFSLVIMSATKLIAVRDPRGFRPLCYGVCPDGTYIVASESCALNAVGASFERDLLPGEILVFDDRGVHSDKTHVGTAPVSTCIFEYIYFARPDSCIDGIPVHEARKQAGRLLARKNPVKADLVVGVPDSGLDAALGYAEESGIPYGIGLIKNKYIGRTFISPGQEQRVDKVRLKLAPITEAVKGKSIVLIDDSIVRGTTSRQIVKLLRDAGVKEIHMRISAPPFVSPCFYGTDIDSKEYLIACNHSIEEIAEIIGVDSLEYLSTDDLREMVHSDCFCSSCFTGSYPTEIPESNAKSRFEGRLSERIK